MRHHFDVSDRYCRIVVRIGKVARVFGVEPTAGATEWLRIGPKRVQ